MSTARRSAAIFAGLVVVLVAYLFAWPVPIDPVAWEAPVDRGLVDPFSADNRLRHTRLIDLSPHEGPEDIAGGPDGMIYTGTSDGNILRMQPDGSDIEIFSTPGGRPLGLEFDAAGNLLIANADLGLQRISPSGAVEVLTDTYAGERILYADDVAVARDGSIYFSDASSKFGAMKSGGSYNASLLDIMEHGGHGRVFRFDPATRTTSVVLEGLNFANGVAVSEDQQFLIINETGTYRVLKHWLNGPDQGRTDVVIDNLPGFPDNVNNGLQGRFWIGLIAPRNRLLDDMSGRPWMRKLVQRLPASIRPQAVPSSHVFAIDASGQVLMNLQDSNATMPALTGVYETRDALWLSSLFGNLVGRLDKQDLARP
jgi:sugar lactone lactonase YvrE